MATELKIDLDPSAVKASLEQMRSQVDKLTAQVEESLGKQAPKSIRKFEEASENGANKISSFWGNLGKRLKEDIKTTFDIARVAGGLKLGEQLASGVKNVFEMERAFDRLNTRLQLTGEQFQKFKHQVGRGIAGTGQKIEDILPGVETASARGMVKDPGQLSAIGEMLGKAKAVTGEDSGNLSETIVDLLHNQGKQVTAQSFKETLDALQSSRVAGSFGSAAEAGQGITTLLGGVDLKHQQSMGLDTRTSAGLAAMGSKTPGGIEALNRILQMGQSAGGQSQVNAMLGNVFKNGKLDTSALSKMSTDHLGQFGNQVAAEGLGVDQAALVNLMTSLKQGSESLNKVVDGSNETAAQFDIATDNLASKLDKFKNKSQQAVGELGDGLSNLGNDLLKGNFKNLGEHASGLGKSVSENAEPLAGVAATGLLTTVLMGGGMKGILNKIPGAGGIAGGLVGGEIAKAAGVQPVYVTNAAEIAGKSGIVDALAGGAGMAGKLAGVAKFGGGALAAGFGGYEVGSLINDKINDMTGGQGIGGKLYDALHPDEFKAAIKEGMMEAHQATRTPRIQTNPSDITGRNRGATN
jgi:hypothetical protein